MIQSLWWLTTTKMTHFIPTRKTVITPQLANLFITHIFHPHELPRSIMSNKDVKLTDQFWTAIFEALRTELEMSSRDHPKTDGQTERVNQTLEDVLRTCH